MDVPAGVIYAAIGALASAIVALFGFIRWAIKKLETNAQTRIAALERHCSRLEVECTRLDKARVECERDRIALHTRLEGSLEGLIKEVVGLLRKANDHAAG